MASPKVHATKKYVQGTAYTLCGMVDPQHTTVSFSHVTCANCRREARKHIRRQQNSSLHNKVRARGQG